MIRRLLNLARDSAGTALIEFTILLPVLLAVLFGAIQFGLLLNNYIMLTNASNAGIREFAASRCIPGGTQASSGMQYACGFTTPYTNTVCQIYVSAANTLGSPPSSLTTACQNYASAQVTAGVIPKVPPWSSPETAYTGVMTITLKVNGTACATDSACETALKNAKTNCNCRLPPATVTASYPCDIVPGMSNLFSFGSCTLTSNATLNVQ
jgi:Flp pilus assembly protein TadG